MRLRRLEQNPTATLGQLTLDLPNAPILWTLEDPLSKDKGPVPCGRYPIMLSYSPHFQMLLPEIRDVPGFTGIRIHAGNVAADTEGCVLCGLYRVSDHEIGDSRLGLGRILALWRVWDNTVIEIEEDFGALAEVP